MFFRRGEEMGCERPSRTAFKHKFWRGRRVRNASVASVMSVKPLFGRRAPPALEQDGFDGLLCRRCLYMIMPEPMATKVGKAAQAQFTSKVPAFFAPNLCCRTTEVLGAI